MMRVVVVTMALATALAFAGTAAARPPAPQDEPVAGTAPVTSSEDGDKKKDKKAEEEQNTVAQNVALQATGRKAWGVIGRAQFRTLVVSDEDPANGRSMNYTLSGTYRLTDWLMLLGRVGLNQRFVAQPDENGVRMQDTLLSAIAMHQVSLKPLGWDRNINFMHRLGLFLPTSYESQLQDLYAAPQWLTQAALPILPSLTFGVTGVFQYRFHQFAERAGEQGTTLPRVVMAGLTFLEYSPLMSKTYGRLIIGADIYGFHRVHYPSRSQDASDEVRLPNGVAGGGEDLFGTSSSRTYNSQSYGYDVYITYLPPVPYFAFTVSLEQGGRVMRDGVVNTFAFHRDETALAFTLTARY